MRKTNSIRSVEPSPFPHVVVEDFLDEDTLDLVIDALAGLEYSFSESDLFSYWASVKLTDIDHPALNVLRQDLGDKIWRTEVAKAFQVSKLSKIDLAAYVYGLGDFLLPHDDQVENRVIAYSLHLTPDLEEEDGGCVDLFQANKAGKSKLVKRIIPKFNSLNMFEVSATSCLLYTSPSPRDS